VYEHVVAQITFSLYMVAMKRVLFNDNMDRKIEHSW